MTHHRQSTGQAHHRLGIRIHHRKGVHIVLHKPVKHFIKRFFGCDRRQIRTHHFLNLEQWQSLAVHQSFPEIFAGHQPDVPIFAVNHHKVIDMQFGRQRQQSFGGLIRMDKDGRDQFQVGWG